MKYQVNVYEVWCRTITVEAASPDEAREKANQVIESDADAEDTFDYSHTFDTDEWPVEEVPSDTPLTVEEA